MANSTMTEGIGERSVVATCNSHVDAVAAVSALRNAGLDVRRLSIVGENVHTEEQATEVSHPGSRIALSGRRGALWGSLSGMAFGAALFFVSTLEALPVMSPLLGWSLGVLVGAAVGGAVGILAGALAGIGRNSGSTSYDLVRQTGQFFVLARGNPDILVHAHAVLAPPAAEESTEHASLLGIHAMPDAPRVSA
jgi:hypothetical protein